MKSNITREEFSKEVGRLFEEFAEEVWQAVVELESDVQRCDEWMRDKGSACLREVLGKALSQRAEVLGVLGACECGAAMEFRQRRPFRVHTVLAGRDVELSVFYGQCCECRQGNYPLLEGMKVDREGFTQALQELSLLAGVIERYRSASEQLLRKFTGVEVSSEKIVNMVRGDGKRAEAFSKEPAERAEPETGEIDKGPLYIGIDGGMVFVDRRWQEVKLGCLYTEQGRIESKSGRGELTERQVVGVRGNPEALGEVLWPRSCAMGAEHRKVVILGDGAPWIWNLAEELFVDRVEILDWYHADENISRLARVVFGEGTDEAAQWRQSQLDRLAEDAVDEVIEGLRFLKKRHRSKRKAVNTLSGYLEKNKHRMKYRTFRENGYFIGSGAVESAVSHVMQQRMKRTGMRWRADGADSMLALRCVYRSTGAWDSFWNYRKQAV